MNPIIQIAGVIDAAEADMLVKSGAEWLGFPLRLAVHREDLSEAAAAEIIRSLPAHVRGVLITYLTDAGKCLQLCRELGASAVQLHADLAVDEVARLRSLSPQLFIIKSLVVRRDNLDDLCRAADAFAPHVDAFITDTYDPETGATGATGKTHDWQVSRHLVEVSTLPVILAGGLTPDNVGEAIRAVRPAGVDAHTGIEAADGRKDAEKVRAFLDAAKAAFRSLELP